MKRILPVCAAISLCVCIFAINEKSTEAIPSSSIATIEDFMANLPSMSGGIPRSFVNHTLGGAAPSGSKPEGSSGRIAILRKNAGGGFVEIYSLDGKIFKFHYQISLKNSDVDKVTKTMVGRFGKPTEMQKNYQGNRVLIYQDSRTSYELTNTMVSSVFQLYDRKMNQVSKEAE